MGRTLRRSKPLSTKSMKPERQLRVVLQRLDKLEIRASTKECNKRPVNQQNLKPSLWLEPDRVYFRELEALCKTNEQIEGIVSKLHEAVKHLKESNESMTNTTTNGRMQNSIIRLYEAAKHLEELNESTAHKTVDFVKRLVDDQREKTSRLNLGA